MKTSTWVAGSAAALVAAALLVWAFAPRPVEVEVAQATLGRFETTIDEDARTRLRDKFTVSAPLAGRLQRIALREGDPVQLGDIVATLTPVLSPMLDDRSMREQRARVGAAEAALQRTRTRIEAAQVAQEQARNDLRRSAQLAQQGFIAPTRMDADRLAAQAAQKELDTAVEGQHMAQHELEQSREALAVVRDAAGGAVFNLRAPLAGRVLKVHQTSETTVALGTPLLELGDTGRMEVVAELLTTDALLARPGSAVRIDRWGGATSLTGTVRLVEPAAFTKVSALGVEEQRVNVLVDITSPQPQWSALGDGYRVGVRIVTRSEENVLRAPVSAVFPLPRTDAASAPGFGVFLSDSGRARLQPVTIGARNGSDAWVQNGLAAGATLIVYPPATVSEGTRVQPRSVK
jgi:HlyD family secretion protein